MQVCRKHALLPCGSFQADCEPLVWLSEASKERKRHRAEAELGQGNDGGQLEQPVKRQKTKQRIST
jgi:hypothetical protein